MMGLKGSPRKLATAVLLIALLLLPVAALGLSNPFLIKLVTRAVIMAIAALSLDIILGLGGMVSFSHAVFLGVGGYVVAIAASQGQYSAWVQWPLALGLSALISLVIGAVSLRSKGVYFIMITLAFCQLFYFLAIGTEAYGGDDGLAIPTRSTLGGLIDLSNKVTFYYFCFFCLLACLLFAWRLSRSHFGRVLRAAALNEERVQALGISTYGYKLAAFVIAGTMCGLAGVLLANHNDFVSPALLGWMQSGDLIVMLVLGGMGTLVGPIVGALILLLIEHTLSTVTEHWQIILGPVLVLMALYSHGGLAAFLPKGRRRG